MFPPSIRTKASLALENVSKLQYCSLKDSSLRNGCARVCDDTVLLDYSYSFSASFQKRLRNRCARVFDDPVLLNYS